MYVATGVRYVEEAVASCAQVRTVMPHIPATLFTDQPVDAPGFERVVLLENPTRTTIDRAAALLTFPYERTLYLDADIYLVQDISDVFDLLDQFDLAAAHAPLRYFDEFLDMWSKVPYPFSQLNTGVIALRRSPANQALLANWQRLYNDYFQNRPNARVRRDQPFFREAVYFSQARLATLPPEYNLRTKFVGYSHGQVKVLHGRHRKLAQFAVEINRNLGARTIRFEKNRLIVETMNFRRWRFMRRVRKSAGALRDRLLRR